MNTRKIFALLTLSVLLLLCLTSVVCGAMSDEDFVTLCKEGTANEIRAALLKGANPNAKIESGNEKGRTALMFAAWMNKKNPEVISLLLKAGANINAKASGGWTALMFAASNPNPEVISLLLKAKADVNSKANNGWTALMWAAVNQNPEILSLLLKAGVDVNKKDEKGMMTALMMAAFLNPNPQVTSLLLEAGADVNARDKIGETALMKAAGHNKNPEVISLLMKAGADVNAKESDGKTAIDLAREKGNMEIVKVLEAVGGDSPETLYQLGVKYATGDGVEADEKKGVELLRRAAAQGHKKAKDALKLFE